MGTNTDPVKTRKWYQKKRYIISLLGAVGIIAISVGNTETSPIPPSIPIVQQVQTTTAPVSTIKTTDTLKASQPSKVNDLQTNNYYTNVDGNKVHSPTYSSSVPADATAQCRDGSYSYSQHHQGTCSHHGGVSTWLD